MTALLLLRSAAGPALGVFTNDSDSAEPAAFISAAGETPSCVLRFSNYTLAFDTTHTNAIHAAGQTPVISWMYGTGSAPPNTTYTLSNLLAGNFDTYMTTYLNAVKALGYTVYVAWSAEMNGNWQQYSEGVNGNTTGQYALAWKYVHDLATSLGVTNIKWVWQPSSIYTTSTPLAGLYPGDAYVDVVAMSGYNWGATQPGGWVDPPDLYNPTLAEIATLTTSKPIWIGEMGCCPDDGGSKTAWYAAFFAWLPTSLVSAFLYFEHAPSGVPNWKVDSGTGTAAAFTAGMAALRSGTSDTPNVASLSLPGINAQNPISTPATGIFPTASMDIRFKGLITDPNPDTRILVSDEAAEGVFNFSTPWDHSLRLQFHSNGWAFRASTVPHTLTMGMVGSLRAVMYSNGTGSDVLFYQSADWDPIADTGTWTQVGTTVNGTESSTLATATGHIFIGYSLLSNANTVTNVVYASVRPYGGAEVASFNPTAVHSTGAQLPTAYTDTHGNTWSIAGSTWSWVTTNVTGTLSAAVPRATATIAGTQIDSATLTGAAPVLTSALTGTSRNPGTLTAPTPRATATLTGTQTNPATMSASAPTITGSTTGTQSDPGTLTTSTPRATATLTGTQVDQATLTAATLTLAAALAGTSTNPGTLTTSTPRTTAALADQATVLGTLSASTPRATATLTGTQTNAGTLAATTPRATATLTGTAFNSGTLAANTPRGTASVTGTMTNTATFTTTVPRTTASLSGTGVVVATLAAILPVATSTIAGTSLNPGTLTASPRAPTATITGTSTNAAMIEAATPTLTATIAGATRPSRDLTITFTGPAGHPLTVTPTGGRQVDITGPAARTLATILTGHPLDVAGPTVRPLTITGPRS